MNLGNGTAYVGMNPWTFVDPLGLEGCRNTYTWHHFAFPQQILNDPKIMNEFRGKIGRVLPDGSFAPFTEVELQAVMHHPSMGRLVGKEFHSRIHATGWNGELIEELMLLRDQKGFLTPRDMLKSALELSREERYRQFYVAGETIPAPRVVGGYEAWNDLGKRGNKKAKQEAIKSVFDKMSADARASLYAQGKAARCSLAGKAAKGLWSKGGRLLGIAGLMLSVGEASAEAGAGEYTEAMMTLTQQDVVYELGGAISDSAIQTVQGADFVQHLRPREIEVAP